MIAILALSNTPNAFFIISVVAFDEEKSSLQTYIS